MVKTIRAARLNGEGVGGLNRGSGRAPSWAAGSLETSSLSCFASLSESTVSGTFCLVSSSLVLAMSVVKKWLIWVTSCRHLCPRLPTLRVDGVLGLSHKSSNNLYIRSILSIKDMQVGSF